MTLSARASTFGGIVRSICLAALRLMMNSNFFGCSTGIRGLGAFQNLVDIRCGAPVQVVIVCAVIHKSSVFDNFRAGVYRRKPTLYRDVYQPAFAENLIRGSPA